MMPRIDWARKHTLLGVFILIALVSSYLFAYTSWLLPLHELAEEQAEMNAAMPSTDMPADRLAEINAAVPTDPGDATSVLGPIAEVHDLLLESTTEEPDVEPPGIFTQRRYTADFTANSAEGVASFLAAVEDNPRHIQVNHLTVSGLQLTLDVTLFSANQATGKE